MLQSICLKNKNNMQVTLVNFGARVHSILFPVAGTATEMLVNYPDINSYQQDPFYLGSTIGRFANRISGGQFTLNGTNYLLTRNSGNNCAHGGSKNFAHHYWQVEPQTSTQAVTFSLLSPHLDQGFPGNLKVQITYQLTEENQLMLIFNAITDQDTAINLTNHCYFNLGEENINNLTLSIAAKQHLALDDSALATGEIYASANTLNDFSQPVVVSERLGIMNTGYVLQTDQLNQQQALLTSQKNNVQLAIFTDQPSIHVYDACGLKAPFQPYQGICLEAQNFVDAINKAHFPNSVLRKGDIYRRTIIYQFSQC